MDKKEKILMGLGSAMVFAAISVGGTVALFQTDFDVNTHLDTGGYHAMLYLTKLNEDKLTADGIANADVDLTAKAGYEAGKGVNLSTYKGEIFDVENIVPTMTGKADFKIINTGNVPFNAQTSLSSFKYFVKDAEKGWVEDANAAIKDQIKFTGLTTDASDPILVPANGGEAEFSVSFLFEDLENNNDAMEQRVTFDIFVTTVQVTKA